MSYLIIGEISVDVTLASSINPYKMRLGGIVHIARACWAMGVDYTMAYISPQYLDETILDFLKSLNCFNVIKIANVTGCPNVFLIENVKEELNQGYQHVLREASKVVYDEEKINQISQLGFTDAMIVSGNYEFTKIEKCLTLSESIHYDVANNVEDFSQLSLVNDKVETIFLSTSSPLFLTYYNGGFRDFALRFKSHTKSLVLKENRGGSRAIVFEEDHVIKIDAQLQPIVHSVGLGDVYDISYIISKQGLSFKESLNFASWAAAEYASTTFPDVFNAGIKALLGTDINDLIKLVGVSLPWEDRQEHLIYIAAPDFNYVDTTQIEHVCESLKYHNFRYVRPIQENGQLTSESSKGDKRNTYLKDLELLNKSDVVIAVLLFNIFYYYG